MRERDWSDEQESQQHDTEASGTRGLQAIENSHSRSVVGRPLMGRATVTMGLEKSAVKTIRTVVWIHLLILMKASTGTDQLGAGSVVPVSCPVGAPWLTQGLTFEGRRASCLMPLVPMPLGQQPDPHGGGDQCRQENVVDCRA